MTRRRIIISVATFVLCAGTALAALAIQTCRALQCLTDVTVRNESQFVERGRSLISAGDYGHGESVLQKVLAYDPKNYEALVALAGQMRHRGRYGESEALFERAAEVDP